MTAGSFARGLADLGDGLYAWLQPDGGWGWSNAGFVTDSGEALLVDTLFDEPLTAAMLAAMRHATGVAPEAIGTLVNTHANGDHTHGNALLPNAEIIASDAAAREMAELPPPALARLQAAGAAGALGEAGEFFAEIFAPFDFARARGRPPTRTFATSLKVEVGGKQVELRNVGPAHTRGDVIVHVPGDRTVFTGDILFNDITPIMWAGPLGNWLAACNWILDQDLGTIVPGHGPLADAASVRRMCEYLRWVDGEARQRFAAGQSAEQAAFDIALGEYRNWLDAERVAVNVDTLFREYRGDVTPPDPVRLFGLMAAVRRQLRA